MLKSLQAWPVRALQEKTRPPGGVATRRSNTRCEGWKSEVFLVPFYFSPSRRVRTIGSHPMGLWRTAHTALKTASTFGIPTVFPIPNQIAPEIGSFWSTLYNITDTERNSPLNWANSLANSRQMQFSSSVFGFRCAVGCLNAMRAAFTRAHHAIISRQSLDNTLIISRARVGWSKQIVNN